MPDREKAIKGFECCHGGRCNDCPYFSSETCANDLNTDVLELLKEQEPVEPIKLENWWKCPSCSGNIVYNMKYCPGCGRKVKWG